MTFVDTIRTILRSLVQPAPFRDWYLVLGVSVISALVLAGIAGSFFFGIRSGDIAAGAASADVSSPSLSRTMLDRVLSAYEERQINFDEGNIRTPDVRDPSR